MQYFTIGVIALLSACSLKHNNPDSETNAVWVPGHTKQVFQANPEDCSSYAFGYFGCREVTKSIPLGLTLSSIESQIELRVAKKIHLNYVFQCASAHTLHAYIALDDGEIELSSTRSGEVKPVVIRSFDDIGALKFTFPAHSRQVDAQCCLTLTSWYALPNFNDLEKTWSSLRDRLRLLRMFNELLGPSPNKTQTIVALKSIRNSFVDEREDLKSQLQVVSDPIEHQLISMQILKLNQKIGDSDCGAEVRDCGLTLALRSLENCGSDDCDSFVGVSQAAIAQELEQAIVERDALYVFIENERKRMQALSLSIDVVITTLFQQIEADRYEV